MTRRGFIELLAGLAVAVAARAKQSLVPAMEPFGASLEVSQPEILDSREGASMASSWTEYLTLTKVGNNGATLEICGYEPLAPRPHDDEGEWDPVLPDEIDGKPVVASRTNGLLEANFRVPMADACISSRMKFTRPSNGSLETTGR